MDQAKQSLLNAKDIGSKIDFISSKDLEGLRYIKCYENGQNILWEGHEFDFIGFVKSGSAIIYKTLSDGRSQMVGFKLPGDMIGRPWADVASCNAVASNDFVLCFYKKKEFEELMETSPLVANSILQLVLDDLNDIQDWMLAIGRKTAKEKVASILAVMASRSVFVKNGEIEFELPMTREGLSLFLGLTLETISRQFTLLKNDGVIEIPANKYKGRMIKVPSLERLLEETGI